MHSHTTTDNSTGKVRVSRWKRGFSLMEMVTACSVLGFITFMAIPNAMKLRDEAERDHAIARAEAIHVAMSTLIQVKGHGTAVSEWKSASSVQNKYAKLVPYLPYSEATLTNFMPSGYTITFGTISPLVKPTLKKGSTTIKY